MNRIFLIAALLLSPLYVRADSVALAELGLLRLEFNEVKALDRYQGQALSARVGFRPGEAVSLVTPYRVQQIRYLVGPGENVAAGQTIAVMSGPEIHHFLTEFEVTAQRLAATQKRYESNRKLYQRQAIDEARWIEISEAYFSLQLEYEHMRHFRELLGKTDKEGDEDRITLHSPARGIIKYRQDSPGIDSGEELALLLPEGSLRLQVSVPLTRRSGLESLATGSCELAVDSVSSVASDFFVEAWSEPVNDSCHLLPGQRLMVKPAYRTRGYLLPRKAVFQWRGQPTVLLRKEEALHTVDVELLSSDGANYAVNCPTEIGGGQVLISSVSAVQGILMGLGGE